jgi:hypothetical protein
MARYFPVSVNTARNALRGLPAEAQRERARGYIKLQLVPPGDGGIVSSGMIPDCLVSEAMIGRYLEITPPVASIMPEFQGVIGEIERTYVRGDLFSAISTACVSTERLLNIARIRLHKYHPHIKGLWNKGPSNAWDENIDALHSWGYIDDAFAGELKALYKDVRNRYLHSGPLSGAATDAPRMIGAAYRLIGIFFGFPEDLFNLATEIGCLNPSDARFQEFYLPELHDDERE